MELVNRYKTYFRNLYTLSNELETTHGRFLPGSPTYLEVLKDMSQRGIQDDRIHLTIEAYENVMYEISNNIEALEILRRF